ncbi:MAG: AAA family ATPase, partial [Snowella sp.]|nr:AAA family ATPase [Snowella sp.]
MKKFLCTWGRYFKLTGYAGTGKSFVSSYFIGYLVEIKIRFCVAAPTHKAVKNLVEMLTQMGLVREQHYQAYTLAQLLGLQPEIDYERGKEVFTNQKPASLKDFDLCIIDEFSMISQDTFEQIGAEIRKAPTKVIFVGDPAQLPPVKESLSPVAQVEMPTATLTEVVRYAGEIARVADIIRSEPQYRQKRYHFTKATDGTIEVLNYAQWFNQVIAYFQRDEVWEDPDYCRVITWTNRQVDRINQEIRQALFGADVAPYIMGDRVIAKRPIQRRAQIEGMSQWAIAGDNRMEFTIIEEPTLCWDLSESFEYYTLPSRGENGKMLELHVLTPKGEQARKAQKERLAREAKQLAADGDKSYQHKWMAYFDLDKRFDTVCHSRVLTAHSA